jgi:microcystin degradation protein MlrC
MLQPFVGGIVHESSTFATAVTGQVRYEDFSVFAGRELIEVFAGTNTCVGGYLAGCGDGDEVVSVPALHARAEPAGEVGEAAYRRLEEELLAALEPGPGGLVLLDLHGAGVIAPWRSLDERLLRAVRTTVGESVTIAVTMDLHGNLPAGLEDVADVIVGFHEYPHIDMADRAYRTARIGVAAARGEVRPHTSLLHLPMVLPPAPTDHGPAAELRELARAAEERPGVLACTVFHGFPYADTPHAGVSIATVTDANPGLGAAINAVLADRLWRKRSSFLIEPLTPEQAVAHVRAGTPRPLIVGDAADNPGGGAAGDGTYLLRAIMESGLRACFATLYDPPAVARAVEVGVGGSLDLELGGRHGVFSGPPLPVRATVRAITDGRVVQQSMRRGKTADFGRSVLLAAGAVEVIVATNRVQVTDPAIFTLHGVRPERFDLVAVKSASHFRSGFARFGGRMLAVDTPGLTTRQIELMTRTGPSARVWPFDRAARHDARGAA